MDTFQIWFERAGGVTAISRSIEIESNALPENEANKLAQLIERSGFFNNGPVNISADNAKSRDHFTYQLTIQRGVHKKTIRWQETEITEKMHPLIAFLSRKLRTSR